MEKNKIFQSIFERLERLEQRVFSNTFQAQSKIQNKSLTLAELVKGKKFKNGQEKIAAIVGYYEKIENKSEIFPRDIEDGWQQGKFDSNYNSTFVVRALKDGLIRGLTSGAYDLSQSGEVFFATLFPGT